ncbi:MAG: tRNA pseudouridine(38-40) synthase TruA [Ruminococcaceae bacterium]|nr:tRNA pseudouridine(38-40) synthase TruA [Oscillospiraceae bacterium]
MNDTGKTDFEQNHGLSKLRKLRRIALLTEYDGREFHGWQTQAKERTVQEVLEQTLARVLKHEVRLIGSSRTDAGVHAHKHVSHFSTTGTIPAERLPYALNGLLPDDLVAQAAAEVDNSFHARFGAVAKTYRYLIYQSRIPSALLAGRAAYLPTPLDIDAMREALPYFLGEHDFSAFRDTSKTIVRRPVRRLDRLDVRQESNLISFEICGSGFLYHMVRIITGTLVAVGLGKTKPEGITDIMLSGDRLQAGKTMPACGLYLLDVEYDNNPFTEIETVSPIWFTGGKQDV